jgi:hypothetical protein
MEQQEELRERVRRLSSLSLLRQDGETGNPNASDLDFALF